MSKPDKPGELQNVTVNAISLVTKAANGEKFKIFKSADKEPQAPEEVKKDERGLFRTLKAFFTGTDDVVVKDEVAEVYHANQSCSKLYELFDSMMIVLGISRYSDNTQKPETDPAKIVSAVDDFRNIALEILLGKSEVEKSGRKISGDRLSKLKNIQSIINDVLDGLDNENTPQEAEELTKEEVQKAVDEAVKAVNVEEVVKNALAPVIERLEKIENARGVSNRVLEDGAVQKNDNNFWGGIF